ncbi:neurotactin [Lycorma delicatula]|uniref:neurotactin n=1 Tax=Lycorma delicatula TaxID=130591 RepID=UPI003F50E4B4
MSTENTLEVVVESSPAKLEVTSPNPDDGGGEEILKSGDKLEIEDEEREKMLNEENRKTSIGGGEVEKKKKALEEAAARQKDDVKRRIPIGAIRMPGFLRSRSRDKNKDGEEGDEGSDLLEPPCSVTTDGGGDHDLDTNKKFNKLTKFKFSNPFNKKKKGESNEDKTDLEPMTSPVDSAGKETDGEGGRTKGLINAIKLPLVNVIPRKLRSTKEQDFEEGTDGGGGGGGGGPAGLASMETLDDSNGSHHKTDEDKRDEAGLETVKLDIPTDEKLVSDPEKSDLDDEESSKWSLPECFQKSRFRSHFKDHQLMGAAAGIVILVVLLIVIIIVAAVGPRPLPSAPVIDGKYVQTVTSCGYVEGLLEDSVFIFRGIPYALSPENDLRWKPPQPMTLKTCWNGTLKAHNSTPICWQKFANGSANGSENCLTLDVITPHIRYTYPLPVIVLVGADTLTGGSPGDMLPSPRLSRAKEVVFVRPNFRLGPTGFLATGPLTRSVHPPTSGNYGLLDLVAALKWVNLNIQHFGGDNKMVTILAHRAGATLVTALTSIRKPEELFARAWLSSGSAIFPNETLMESEKKFIPYMERLECDINGNADCLKKQDVEHLLDLIPDEWTYKTPELPPLGKNSSEPNPWLVLDGAILKEHPSEVWKRGDFKLQLVIGTTAHVEATKDLKEKKSEWNAEDVAKIVRSSQLEKLGLSEEALRRYNTSFSGLAAMISDIRTVCPLFHLATQIPNTGFYVVTQPYNELAEMGVDIKAILGSYRAKSPEQRRFVIAMQQMFYRFVAFGKFDAARSDSNKDHIILVGQDPHKAVEYPNCDFWISKDVVPRYGRAD